MSQPTEIRRQGIPERVAPSGIATRVVEDEQVARRPARSFVRQSMSELRHNPAAVASAVILWC